jgi:glycine dehydrogenase subunit 1
MRYLSLSDADRRAMLASIGVSSIEDLFADIPATVADRFRPIGLAGRSEQEVVSMLSDLAARNRAATAVCFAGGGVYDHYAPSLVDHVILRSEFYTAYTPYQPEVSQGTLTAMFEFQTMICELTGMDVANASLYDGATAAAEAALMAERLKHRGRIAVAESVFGNVRRVLDTYCWASGIEIVELPHLASGTCDLSNVPEDVSAVVLQSPNAFGVIEPLVGVKEQIGDSLLIVSVNPISLGVLAPPGAYDADIVVGEGQPLGLPMGYGGPLLGIFASKAEYLRQIPGRVSGRTVDAEGAVGYTMAAQTREQHIRRERATSNICTNSALCALAATVYLSTVGAGGLRRVAELCVEKAHYLSDRIAALDGFEIPFSGAFFNEFIVRVPGDADALHRRLLDAGCVIESPDVLRSHGLENTLRIAVTEKRTREDLDRLVELLGGAR